MASMAATCGSSALSTLTPPGSSPRTISLFACAMRSTEPNSPRWATPTLSTTATSGGAMVVSRAISPTWLAPISATKNRVDALTLSAVSGRPTSLLNDPTGATVPPSSLSSAWSRSLVVVLPTEPVMPTMAKGSASARRRSMLCLASRPSAATVSLTTIWGSGASTSWSTSAHAAPCAATSGRKSCPSTLSPVIATNTDPPRAWRESLTAEVATAARSSMATPCGASVPPTASATSGNVIGIMVSCAFTFCILFLIPVSAPHPRSWLTRRAFLMLFLRTPASITIAIARESRLISSRSPFALDWMAI